MGIKVLQQNQIDKQRWDELVLAAGGPIYSTFDYLSSCNEWEAVVLEENQSYQLGVPIPYRVRRGIKYIYQSPFICHFTFLSREENDSSLSEFRDAWLQHVQSFIYVAKYFFYGTPFNGLKGYEISHHGGLKIDLTRGYQDILKRYSHNRLSDVKKPAKNLTITLSDDIELFFNWNAKLSVPKIKSFQTFQLTEMKSLWRVLSSDNMVEIYFATIDEEILSGNLVGKFGTSLYSLATFSTAKGRKTNALTLITDHVLKKYAGSNYVTYDFGDLAKNGIDNFKMSFGAERYPTYQIYRNNLPWYIKLPKTILNFFRVAVS